MVVCTNAATSSSPQYIGIFSFLNFALVVASFFTLANNRVFNDNGGTNSLRIVCSLLKLSSQLNGESLAAIQDRYGGQFES